MNKKYFFSGILMIWVHFSIACDMCNKGSDRSKFWEIFSHGRGPDGNVDYLLFASGIIIVLLTLIYSLKFLIFPKEKNKNHIKYSILK
ncbi:MAG: hypothetical protein Q4G27_00530 [Flavobacteriaceae bacterium]|nr:hypothetical protein [Flavobacteriaceae bacterium]